MMLSTNWKEDVIIFGYIVFITIVGVCVNVIDKVKSIFKG